MKISLFTLNSIVLSTLASASPACIPYGKASIHGTLNRHTFYGAPGFGEDPAHDAKEAGFYLDLPTPICTIAGENENEAKQGVRRVQLVLNQKGYDTLRPKLGKSLTLRGELFGALTGYHHAPLLLDVKFSK
ncbi:DUF4431 domain-containing protein [Burkholderiaceae bacterium DAT-1]|nr:DUF4431 domain-containing protein [Burkholderiaceae bacterium DAT-1]